MSNSYQSEIRKARVNIQLNRRTSGTSVIHNEKITLTCKEGNIIHSGFWNERATA